MQTFLPFHSNISVSIKASEFPVLLGPIQLLAHEIRTVTSENASLISFSIHSFVPLLYSRVMLTLIHISNVFESGDIT